MRRIALLALAAGVLLWGLTPDAALAKRKKKGGKDPVLDAFKDAYKSEDAGERAKAVEGLAKAEDAQKFAILSKSVVPKEKRADVIGRCVLVLEGVKDEAVIAQIAAAAAKTTMKAPRRVVYVEALANMPQSKAAHDTLLALVEDKQPFVRGMTAYALGKHRLSDALEPLMGLLEDPNWVVQSAAIAALPKLRDREALKAAVPRLVDFLENVTGRLRTDCGNALGRITGKRLGRNPKDWRDFLAGKGAKLAEEETPKGPKPAYGNENKPHFYGVTVTSNRVVLLLDMSLSMYEPVNVDVDRLRRETSQRVITGKDAPKDKDAPPEADEFDIPWWRVKTCLDLARYQTIYLVSQLEEEQHFEIITFSTDVHPWMGRLVPATSANKQKAIQMLRELKPDDKTNTWGAIAAAFDMMHDTKKGKKMAPDEMYLVTDGEPSVGDIIDKDQFYAAALQLWKMKQMRINCIGIGVKLPFMKKLCRKTGGVAKFFE